MFEIAVAFVVVGVLSLFCSAFFYLAGFLAQTTYFFALVGCGFLTAGLFIGSMPILGAFALCVCIALIWTRDLLIDRLQ